MADPQRLGLSRMAAYGLAVALAIGGLLLRAALPLGPGIGIYPLSLAMVLLSAWYGGGGPGWTTALISALRTRDFFIAPPYFLSPNPPAGIPGPLPFLARPTPFL